jgi:hypothetical protein
VAGDAPVPSRLGENKAPGITLSVGLIAVWQPIESGFGQHPEWQRTHGLTVLPASVQQMSALA